MLFGTRNNTPVTVRNIQRDLKLIGRRTGMTGVRFSPHGNGVSPRIERTKTCAHHKDKDENSISPDESHNVSPGRASDR